MLVTFVPIQWSALIARYGTTLAIIDKDAQPPYVNREEHWREVIHRHAHGMAEQDPGSNSGTESERVHLLPHGVAARRMRGSREPTDLQTPHHNWPSEFR